LSYIVKWWGRPDLNRRPFPETAFEGCFYGFPYRPLQNLFIPRGVRKPV
jgi:hypothetical protein